METYHHHLYDFITDDAAVNIWVHDSALVCFHKLDSITSGSQMILKFVVAAVGA
jgi:hypothetical protein